MALGLIWRELKAAYREIRWRHEKSDVVRYQLDQKPFNEAFGITSQKDSNVQNKNDRDTER